MKEEEKECEVNAATARLFPDLIIIRVLRMFLFVGAQLASFALFWDTRANELYFCQHILNIRTFFSQFNSVSAGPNLFSAANLHPFFVPMSIAFATSVLKLNTLEEFKVG